MLCGRKVSTECSTGAPSAVQVTCSISSAAVVAVTASALPIGSRLVSTRALMCERL